MQPATSKRRGVAHEAHHFGSDGAGNYGGDVGGFRYASFRSPPPNCETGQVKAALNGKKDIQNFFKHLGNAGECLFGFPPGEP